MGSVRHTSSSIWDPRLDSRTKTGGAVANPLEFWKAGLGLGQRGGDDLSRWTLKNPLLRSPSSLESGTELLTTCVPLAKSLPLQASTAHP